MAAHPTTSPQHWHLVSPVGPDLLPGSLCHGVPLLSPWHTAPKSLMPSPVLSPGLTFKA